MPNTTPTKLTSTEWAMICTIHQEPRYQFIYNEAKTARRMEAKGLLKSAGGKRYTVTELGERLYAEDKLGKV